MSTLYRFASAHVANDAQVVRHVDGAPIGTLRPLVECVTALSQIQQILGARGIRFERWRADVALPNGATNDAILAAYAPELARLRTEAGYPSADVVRLVPDDANPAWPELAAAARAKFLAEHRHAEDEVRFFVDGSGVFYLRFDDEVLAIRCERGDLLGVPAGTRHWFDMGRRPHFCAIRVFGTADGWRAEFTGDDIASQHPSADALAATRTE
jgi:1,2-dihydroxy-3-keto-5-methylthiopentene dioxygenase